MHGWGSRASHTALIGRIIAKSGFRVVAYDAPAHSSLKETGRAETSNFLEFSRAIVSISDKLGPFDTIVGHSLGALASLYAVAGHPQIADHKISTRKLVLISLPVSVERLVQHFCHFHGLNEVDCIKLKKGLEETFHISIADFTAASALQNIEAETLLVHDSDDKDFPITDIYELHNSFPNSNLCTTSSLGHQKIVMNRQMIMKISEFLTPG